jgi:hypothetical protein
MKSIFGGLLEFDSQFNLTNFAEALDIKTSIKILENAAEYGMKNGLYSLEEAYCLYMCLQKLKVMEVVEKSI